MAQLLLPMSRFGFLLAIGMGFLLFSADASRVVRNPAFRMAHCGAAAPGGARVTALLSLLLWLSTVCAGRLIAYR